MPPVQYRIASMCSAQFINMCPGFWVHITAPYRFLYSTLLLYLNDVGVKNPNYDAYGLFRALHSHNPPNYSHIVGLASYILYYVKYIEVNIKLSTQKTRPKDFSFRRASHSRLMFILYKICTFKTAYKKLFNIFTYPPYLVMPSTYQ